MGVLDFLYLSFFTTTLFMASISLFLSLKKTDDVRMKAMYRQQYIAIISGSIIMLILYVFIVSYGNVVIGILE